MTGDSISLVILAAFLGLLVLVCYIGALEYSDEHSQWKFRASKFFKGMGWIVGSTIWDVIRMIWYWVLPLYGFIWLVKTLWRLA